MKIGCEAWECRSYKFHTIIKITVGVMRFKKNLVQHQNGFTAIIKQVLNQIEKIDISQLRP